MRKLAVIGAVLLALTTSAQAEYYGHRHYYHGGGGGGDWAAPLVGGLIIGGILGNMAAQPRYDAYPQPGYGYYQPQTYCRMQPVYDYNGWYVGQRRYCWQQ